MNRADLLGSTIECECGHTHNVPVRRFINERGAIEKLPLLLRDIGLVGNVFMLADETTFEVAGRRAERLLIDDGFSVNCSILPENPKADDRTLDVVRGSWKPSTVLVSCGSGTVTDLAKQLAHEKGLPLIAVATAPSMNGYASSVVALMRGGVKITLPVRPALGVVVDVDIMSAAPIEMIRAGLGDAMAKPVCNADWKLSHIMRGQHFCGLAFELIKDLEPIYIEHASDIGKRDPRAIGALSEALLFSGISMVLAGSSAPASGGEHLISHTLDMHAPFAGRKPDFHGTQVGVATLLTSRFYERLFEMGAGEIKRIIEADPEGPSEGDVEKRVRNYFGPLAMSVLEQYKIKQLNPEERRKDRRRLAESWEEIRREVSPHLMSSSAIEKALREAGCKTSYSELGVSRDEFIETAYLARTIRPRYNVLDVAWELGVLGGYIEEVV